MDIQSRTPPYFKRVFQGLAAGDEGMLAAFGRHVHWGYWEDPPESTCTPRAFGIAAERLSRRVCELAGIQHHARIADVGCGFGGTIASLNERFSNLKLTGINVDIQQLTRAREMVLPQNENTIEFIQAAAERIPLPDGCLDQMLAVESAFHFDRPSFLAEARRLLNAEGSLTISDFVISDAAAEYLRGFNLFDDQGIQSSYGDVDLSWSLPRYRQLANDNGFTISNTIDITEQTMPTYDFLYAHTASLPPAWQDPEFLRATRMLEKSSRKGLMKYVIVRFQKA